LRTTPFFAFTSPFAACKLTDHSRHKPTRAALQTVNLLLKKEVAIGQNKEITRTLTNKKRNYAKTIVFGGKKYKNFFLGRSKKP
jgi:hypothetical protein